MLQGARWWRGVWRSRSPSRRLASGSNARSTGGSIARNTNLTMALQKMNLAVGQLVDRGALGRRLLGGCRGLPQAGMGCDLPGTTGRAYRPDSRPGTVPSPMRRPCRPRTPLVERLRHEPTVRAPHGIAPFPASDPATDTMIGLGGRSRQGTRGRWRTPRADGPGAEAEWLALRGRGGRLPGRPRLGRQSRAPLGRNPADARAAQSRTQRQGGTRSPSSSGASSCCRTCSPIGD